MSKRIMMASALAIAFQTTFAVAESANDDDLTSSTYQILPLPEDLPEDRGSLTLRSGIYSVETNNPNAPVCYLAVTQDKGGSSGRYQVQIDLECPPIN